MKKQTKLITAFAAATAAFALSANAASISVNTGPVGQEVDGSSTGVVASTAWNDKMAGNFGATDVKDDSGTTLVGTTVSVNTSWTQTTGAGNSDSNHTLMNGAMDNGGGPHGFTMTNVPYALYDVYIYHEGGSDQGRGGAFEVWDSDNGDAVLGTQNSYDTTAFAGTFIEASTVGIGGSGLDINGDPVESNYVKFSGLTASNIKIRSIANLLGNPETPRAPIPGFQIVEVVPEPSTTALLGLGGLALIFRRRK